MSKKCRYLLSLAGIISVEKHRNLGFPGCHGFDHLSNEKRAPGCLGCIGEKTTQLCGDYFINHDIRIPINQPV